MNDEHDANEANIHICLISCQTKQGLFALVPCGHANLCKNCGQHFIDKQKTCPICRSEIVTSMRIFNN